MKTIPKCLCKIVTTANLSRFKKPFCNLSLNHLSNPCSYDLILDVVAAVMVQVEEGKKKVHYHVGACKSRMVKCTAFGYSRDKDMLFLAIQEVVNYTRAVLEASNVDLSHLCLEGITDGSSLGAIFNHFTGKFGLSPNMVSNQFVQDHFHKPSLVAYDSPELLESSSKSVHQKRTPLDDPRTSQVLPEATSKKVTASVGTDHRKAVVVIVIRDTASQPLNT
nr:hypothetical protein [Tanacetum cinerariifolium]